MEARGATPAVGVPAASYSLQPTAYSLTAWFGPALLVVASAQLLTGMLLALYYRPVPDGAWESVQFIETEVSSGRLLRGIHSWGATALIVGLLLHSGRVFLQAAFQGPRRWSWASGALLVPVVLATSFTGYLLPWNAKGFFAAQVGSQMVASTPFIGEKLQLLLQGEDSLGAATLTRAFAVHATLFPLAIVLGLLWHLWLARSPGLAKRRDVVAGVIVLLLLAALAAWRPAPLEMRADEAPAGYVPRPEWYFLPLFQLLRYLPGDWILLGTVVVPVGLTFLLLLVPWLEREPAAELRQRKLPLALAGGILYAGFVLLVLAHLTDEPPPRPPRPVSATDRGGGQPVVGSPERGHTLYQTLHCAACHAAGPARELAAFGSRVEPDWTREFLLTPRRLAWESPDVRPLARMPDYKLTPQEAADLAAYLDTRRAGSPYPEPTLTTPLPATVRRGAGLFEERGCLDCHKSGERGKQAAPDLSDVALRLKAGYLRQFLTDPAETPANCPRERFHLTPEEATALFTYLVKEKPYRN
jgi:ubiquinol-cytochrome c reductase cytochrome b subunit